MCNDNPENHVPPVATKNDQAHDSGADLTPSAADEFRSARREAMVGETLGYDECLAVICTAFACPTDYFD
jgi:hypothetical protein